MKNYRDILNEVSVARRKSAARSAKQGKELEKAKKQAARWSLDDQNSIGQAIVTFLGGKYTVSASASPGVFIIAKYIDGKEVQIPDNKYQ